MGIEMFLKKSAPSWKDKKNSISKKIYEIKRRLKKQLTNTIKPTANNESLKTIYKEREHWIEACLQEISVIEKLFSLMLSPRSENTEEFVFGELIEEIQKLENALPDNIQFKAPYEKEVYPILLSIERKVKKFSSIK